MAENILNGKLNAAIMQGGRQDLRLSLPLPKIENPNAKQSVQKKPANEHKDKDKRPKLIFVDQTGGLQYKIMEVLVYDSRLQCKSDIKDHGSPGPGPGV